MENPKCPYCGEEMEYYWDNNPMMPQGRFFCPKCHSQAPTAKTEGEAYAAAMKRDRAKGEWIDKGESPFFGSEGRMYFNHEYECNHCGFTVRGGEPKFCPNCGAEMRKGEANDEP